MKQEVPEIEGPKVLDKIDLSTIDSSTRPKKGAKKTKEAEPAPSVPEEKTAKGKGKKGQPAGKQGKKDELKVEEEVEEKEIPVLLVPEEDLPPVIENIKRDKLEGPKILGKIDLPVDNDTRPKKDEKRKKKRKKKTYPDRKERSQAGSFYK